MLKPFRIRVRVTDGKATDWGAVKARLFTYVDVFDAGVGGEFIVAAANAQQIENVQAKLESAGLGVIEGGATDLPERPTRTAPLPPTPPKTTGPQPTLPPAVSGSEQAAEKLKNKPYGFVSLPQTFTTAPPVWHDGSGSKDRLSGEIRFELTSLTPLLVGWERQAIEPEQNEPAVEEMQANEPKPAEPAVWPVPHQRSGKTVTVDFGHGRVEVAPTKSVLCPLRAPWGQRPVLIPGDSIKGLLRQELGALLGAPMERAAERSYSYRPNARFPEPPGARLVPRLARIAENGVEVRELFPNHNIRVPTAVELLPPDLTFDRTGAREPPRYAFDETSGLYYRGGLGAGVQLTSKRDLHKFIRAEPSGPTVLVDVPPEVQDSYVSTARHLADIEHGHFSSRNSDIKKSRLDRNSVRARILRQAEIFVFRPDDLFWVEWDSQEHCVVSLGWNYYYRWAYFDTVRRRKGDVERSGLFPLDLEKKTGADHSPLALSPVRRLFGYVGGKKQRDEGCRGIGDKDHEQLMGRLSVNAAIEVVSSDETPNDRFIPPTFLRQLGEPRPSAVEYYLKQRYHPKERPSDHAKLETYGDATGYDVSGELAGRKFYLDRRDVATEPWKGDCVTEPKNKNSTLALEASKPGRRFRFTLRFRDLDPAELAAVLAALCPDQFREALGGGHPDGYCSKLGYARPLGWGSVQFVVKALLLLDPTGAAPVLTPVTDVATWVKSNHTPTAMQSEWLAIHRRRHPDAGDYPGAPQEPIYKYHSKLRADHALDRRYPRRGA